MTKAEKRRLIGYLVGTHENGLLRWGKSDSKEVPWALFTSWTRPTIFPDKHAARTAIRQSAKYWSQGRFKVDYPINERRRRYYIIRAEAP